MPDIKISALPAASPLTGTEELPLVQGGVTSKATAQDIANLGGGLTIPTVSITPALPSYVSLQYKDPSSFLIDGVTIQSSTYSVDFAQQTQGYSYYYGYNGNNLITAFSTDTEVLGEIIVQFVYQSSTADPSITSISLPTVKYISSNSPSNAFGQLSISNNNITSVSLSALEACGGLNFVSVSGLTTLSLPNLTFIRGNDGIYSISGTLNLTTLSLPSLVYNGGTININEGSSSMNISLPSLVFCDNSTFIISLGSGATSLDLSSLQFLPNTGTFTITMSGLTSFSLPALKVVSVGGPSFTFNTTLDQTSVDSLLATFAAMDGTLDTSNFNSGSLTIAGANAAPSGAGYADAAIISARGVTVTTN